MKRLLLFALLMPLFLFAYQDSDLDGVEDKDDLCPNTSLIEIVDNSGCTIERLVVPDRNSSSSYDVVIGIGESKNSTHQQTTKTLTETLQVDYFYKNFSLQLSTSHFKLESNTYDKSGMGDSYLGGSYRIELAKKLKLNFGGRLNIPTYESQFDNNNLDYTLFSSLNYRVDNFSFVSGVGYTFVNDDDINTTTYKLYYQNSLNYHIGVGYYFLPRLYGNISYLNSQSIYRGSDDLSSLSLYGYYAIDAHWFSSFSYTKGISDEATDRSLLIRVGYYF